MKQEFTKIPLNVLDFAGSTIYEFDGRHLNSEPSVIENFGDEWNRFDAISNNDINKFGETYFDILDDSIINKNTYAVDLGCGTGRFSKYLSEKVGFIEAIDPSNSVNAAAKLLKGVNNVRISKAIIGSIPFDSETFDFGMSVGVLHHIPNTQTALNDCVKLIKINGYFYVYLYYNLENSGILFRMAFFCADLIRRIVCKLPASIKHFVCDLLAIFIYLPYIYIGKLLKLTGFFNLSKRIPLSYYQDKSFFIIRNDSLDRFGTELEHRFSKIEVIKMMENAGLCDIKVSNKMPYWHAVGRRQR